MKLMREGLYEVHSWKLRFSRLVANVNHTSPFFAFKRLVYRVLLLICLHVRYWLG